MTNRLTPLSLPPSNEPGCHGGRRRAPLLLVAALPLLVTGCYRSTGLSRQPMVAEVIPETGGDRVPGMKSVAGPGDYFVGNDFLEVAVDGTPFLSTLSQPMAGARSGGGIVDAGYVVLDTSFRRVSAPSDMVNRMTPVVNQDPNLQMVFTSFTTANPGGTAYLVMQGALLDPAHAITGATWDGNNLVQGVTITHTLSLGELDHFLTLQTILTNNTGVTLGIQNVGDALLQPDKSGFRFAIPATFDLNGNVLGTRWGMQIPGSDFTRPLATAVLAPEVGLLGTELGADTMDAHVALGFMPMDADNFAVTSDPQDVFTELRPLVAPRLVVGSLPVPAGLAANTSITHNRRLYFMGGQSSSPASPSGTTALFNMMDADKNLSLRPRPFGYFQFSMAGSAQRQGPVPCEIRIERNLGTSGSPLWQLQRVEWMEPANSIATPGALPASTLNVVLPVGTYRVVARNATYEYTKTEFTNSWVNPANPADDLVRYLPAPVVIQPSIPFVASGSDVVCPEAASIMDNQGYPVTSLYSLQFFSSHERDAPAGNLQPLRFTFVGTNGTPDPVLRRMINVDSIFNAANRGPGLVTPATAGQYQFRGGNSMFGTGFTGVVNSEFNWFPNPPLGSSAQYTYTAYGTRGPLSYLESAPVTVFQGQTANTHPFLVFPMGLPTGWTSFDLPGPSQATTGGYGQAEKLVSAMAEGVQVVAATDMDLQVDPVLMYNNYQYGYTTPVLSTAQRIASLSDILRLASTNGMDPFVVGARSSNLSGFGGVTALFTPTPTASRFGGARPSTDWTLADFLTQAGGGFNVVNRPCGPQGLFTLMAFDPTVALGQGTNAWWLGQGTQSFGQSNGGFDGLELLHAEGLNSSDPTLWFQEFLRVRSAWFAILNQQTPTKFTKGLGCSGALYSLDTPVGLARTYLKANVFDELDLNSVLSALQAGAAVASTGPFLDVSIGTAGPGGFVAGPAATVTLNVNLTMTDWMPVDELRVIVNGIQVPVTLNGQQYTSVPPSALTPSTSATTLFTGTLTVPMPTAATGAWVVVEAGVPLATQGPYRAGTPWNQIMKGMYPIAVTNPIFVDVTGTGYTAPGL